MYENIYNKWPRVKKKKKKKKKNVVNLQTAVAMDKR